MLNLTGEIDNVVMQNGEVRAIYGWLKSSDPYCYLVVPASKFMLFEVIYAYLRQDLSGQPDALGFVAEVVYAAGRRMSSIGEHLEALKETPDLGLLLTLGAQPHGFLRLQQPTLVAFASERAH